MSSKGKSSPAKSSPKKPVVKKPDAGVSKTENTSKAVKAAERFKKAETKTTKVSLRGTKPTHEVEQINKNLVAARKDGKKKRLTALERTALEGSNFALKQSKKK